MINLEDVSIFENDKLEYSLTYCEKSGFTKKVSHDDVVGYGFLYAFFSEDQAEALLKSPYLHTEENTWYSCTHKQNCGSIIILIINKEFLDGICVYEDYRPKEPSLSLFEVEW